MNPAALSSLLTRGRVRAFPRRAPTSVGMGGAGERRRLIGDLVVQAAQPALVVMSGSLLEGGDVAIRRHGTDHNPVAVASGMVERCR